MKTVARCGIYEERPDVCRKYPQVDHWMPDVCTYTFPGGGTGEREGECACDVGACCATPREGGEPGGAPIPEHAGGTPCKHMVWEDVPEEETEKTASSSAGTLGLLRVLGHGE